MARYPGPQQTAGAAMGASKLRPIYSGINSGQSIAESIAAEWRKAARQAAASRE